MKNTFRQSGCKIILVALLANLHIMTFAQDVRILPAVSRSYAITQVTVFQGPGRKVDGGTILIKDGLITAVGKGLTIPPDATIIKGDSLYVYAGFIDGLSRIGVTKQKEEVPKEKAKDPGNPSNEQAGTTPYIDVRNLLNPIDKPIEEFRALGFTVAQVVPYGGMMAGSGAIVRLDGNAADKMVIKSKSAFYAEFANAERVYPNTILGIMAKWKELYKQASLTKSYSSVYASNRSGIESPTTDRVLESFYPVIDKQEPVLFKGEKNLDIQRILSLKSQLGFNVQVAEIKEGWDLITKLNAAGSKIFLSLELPEEKKPNEKTDKEKKKDDLLIVPDSVELKALQKRTDDFTAKYVGQAAAFNKANVPFGFSGLSVKSKDVIPNLRRMIKAGLSEDAALAALTINAAQALGLSDRLGTLDAGKVANIVISHKPYFDEKAKVKYVFIDGKIFETGPPVVDKSDKDKKSEKP
ncbi:MAG: amidohydrolase family protein [Chryseolinea sp.]